MNQVVETLKAMSEIYGRQISPGAAVMMATDLENFPEEVVLTALTECRKQLRYFPTVGDVIQRIQNRDGRPGVEEAWAMLPKDESSSVVWTEEMATAFGVCRDLIQEDPIAARMAFKESYEKAVRSSRDAHLPVLWTATLGFNREGRAAALIDAVGRGRLQLTEVKTLMPEIEDYTTGRKLLAEQNRGLSTAGEVVEKVLKQVGVLR